MKKGHIKVNPQTLSPFRRAGTLAAEKWIGIRFCWDVCCTFFEIVNQIDTYLFCEHLYSGRLICYPEKLPQNVFS